MCCFKQAFDEGLDDTLPGPRLPGRDGPGLGQRSLRPDRRLRRLLFGIMGWSLLLKGMGRQDGHPGLAGILDRRQRQLVPLERPPVHTRLPTGIGTGKGSRPISLTATTAWRCWDYCN